MRSTSRTLSLLGAAALACPRLFAAAEPSPTLRYNRDIHPIIADACFHCHGPDPESRKAKLRFDREEGFFGKREDGPNVVPGKPESSPLYLRIVHQDLEEVMPPPPPKGHRQLKPEEQQRIKRWIEQGAKWEPHWSFVAPEKPEAPAVQRAAWVRDPIDRFVLARLEARGLAPAPEADRRTLARRLSLDLTGLPPEPALVDAFLADASADAYGKLVDRLLASPRYGEHRARYWLDAARYADTHGLHFDNYREMWPYRDWVIGAFNRNLPFDQFTVEQIAGDLLPDPTPDQLIATGFHRCNITTNEGGTIAEENLALYARDRVETTSWVWLGLTANCAVCHDHKFDPIPTRDFYAMSAYFRNTTQGALDGNVRDTAPVLVLPKADDQARWTALPQEIDAARKAHEQRKGELRKEFDAWLAKATIAEWDAASATLAPPAVHLPLDGARADGAIVAKAGGAEAVATTAEPVAWGEAPGGKAATITDKTAFALADIGDLEKDKPFSYGAWVRLPKEHGGSGALFSRMDDGDGYRGWDLWVQDNEFAAHLIHRWADDALKVRTTGNALKRDTWQHVLVTYDGSGKAAGMKIHVDGKSIKTQTEADTLKSTTRTTAPFRLGRRKNGDILKQVQISDVRIYDHALPGKDIARLGFTQRAHAILAQADKDRQAKDKDDFFEVYGSSDAALVAAAESLAKLEEERKAIRSRSPVTHVQEEKRGSMPIANVLMRGEYDKLGEKVDAGVFTALHPLPPDAPKNRLGLARWLVSPANPLTARVVVNRLWQEVFGTGLVKTAEDFGIMGEAPSHPELLDHLAVEFRDHGWDVKRLIRAMVMSATYRQEATATPEKLEKDLDNRLFSRGPRFRMDAEMIRDYALAAGGVLAERIGGPSARPYQPENVWEVVGMPESDTRHYKRDGLDGLHRRSLYTFWKRAAPPASMDVLNAPSRETSCLRRERTNTPLQALVTLNDPQFIEAARLLAQAALVAAKDDAGRIAHVALRVLARPLAAKEVAIVQDVLGRLRGHYRAQPEDAKALLAVGETKADAAHDPAELAAMTMLCNQMLNLDEALNK